MRIAFVGGGNMGEAMIRSILEKEVARPTDITASDVSDGRRSYLSQKYGIVTLADNRSAADRAEAVVLAVKPVSMPSCYPRPRRQVQPWRRSAYRRSPSGRVSWPRCDRHAHKMHLIWWCWPVG